MDPVPTQYQKWEVGTKHLVPLLARYNGDMRQFLIALPLALALFVGATPAYAANLPLLDASFSIVPSQCTSCPCGLGGALQFIQNLMNAAISVGIIMFVFVAVYAGFLFIFTATNPEAHSQAKKLLSNAVIGFVIILASWIFVDFVMKILYDGSPSGFGPWNEILATDGSQCIQPQDITGIKGLPGVVGAVVNGGVIGGTPAGSVGSVGTTHGLCDARNTSCSPAVMKAEGLNDAQANAMSCIAVTESGGDPLVGGSGTGAQGLFQITGTNWSNPAYHSGSCSVQTSRNNATCNRQTAVLMFKSVGYQPWTGKCMSAGGCGKVSYGQYWNPNAVACVQKYDPGARI